MAERWLHIHSKHHALVAVATGALVSVTVTPSLPLPAVILVSVGFGVGVDVDHFLIARYNTGNWTALRNCARDPTIVFTGQDEIFAPGEVGTLNRLLSHVALGGIAVVGTAVVSPDWALVVLAALYTHVLADLTWDVSQQDIYVRRYEESPVETTDE